MQCVHNVSNNVAIPCRELHVCYLMAYVVIVFHVIIEANIMDVMMVKILSLGHCALVSCMKICF